MASSLKNLSTYDQKSVPSAHGMRFGIVVSEWNEEVTKALSDGCLDTLLKFGAHPEDIVMRKVPGSFELTLGAKMMAERLEFDAIICLGCMIQGETRHFDFICNAVSQGITQLNIMLGIPIVFGVLTPENQQQAIDRAGGKHGNKGDEAAITAIKMVALQSELDPLDSFDDPDDRDSPLNIVN